MDTIQTDTRVGPKIRVSLIAYTIGVPLITLVYYPIFLKLFGDLFALGDSPFPRKAPLWLKVGVNVLAFPFLYLLNIESLERAVQRVLPDTQTLFFFTALNGVFWGFSIVSSGLLIYRRKHRST